jgi:hypothetical protein
MSAPSTRVRASLLLAALFTGGILAGSCHPTEDTYTPPVGSINHLGEARP